MAITFEITAAQIVALFMECILYGIYLVSFGYCLRAILAEKAYTPSGFKFKTNINWITLVFALLLGLFATLDIAFGLRHNLDAFAYYKGPGGAVEELQDISYWVNVMKTADYVAQTFIGDAMLLYRCYIVYERSWKVIVPSVIFWIGGSTSGALLVHTFATLDAPALINTTNAQPFSDAMIGSSLALNVVTTGLIVWKIWSIDKQNASIMTNDTDMRTRSFKLHQIVRIIIDSAALYTIATTIFVITYVAGSNASYGTSDCVVQIIGISFNLIIIRVDAGKSTTADSTGRSQFIAPQNHKFHTQNSFPFSLYQSTIDQSEIGRQADSYTTNSVSIKVEVDRDLNVVEQDMATCNDNMNVSSKV
ncbi:hypothetical protein L218DRAFT_1050468 [Marasmius fiardii PR-910]|nr:hypothetical protein L218DRAFT_1050468 [Marasmius fiardii PR-910]